MVSLPSHIRTLLRTPTGYLSLAGRRSGLVSMKGGESRVMPMSEREQIRLLSMVDVFEPLSEDEMEELAKRTPDTFLEEGDILYTPQDGTERLFVLKEGRVQVYEVDKGGEEITLTVVE